jgi:hypothetical protein
VPDTPARSDRDRTDNIAGRRRPADVELREMRRTQVIAAVGLTASVLVPFGASAASPPSGGTVAGSPIIAVIDTGVRVSHLEFDYRGPDSKTDQVVAWWDFSPVNGRAVTPRPGQLWDHRVRDPYDDAGGEGHGTAVASMAVGLRRPGQTPSAAPGYRLAVAKLEGPGGTGSIADAVEWAVHTVHASVINISYGTMAPVPAATLANNLDAIDDAWRSGVFVVVGNGNGTADANRPGESGWDSGYAMSTSVLSVGGSHIEDTLQTTDPEVTTNENVNVADSGGDHGYKSWSGTSFASPFAAGFAARLIAAARSAHRTLKPDLLRRLIEYSAVDTDRPPLAEGYGAIGLAQLPAALQHARAGTLPKRPNPDDSGWYVENVSMKLRDLWSNQLRLI